MLTIFLPFVGCTSTVPRGGEVGDSGNSTGSEPSTESAGDTGSGGADTGDTAVANLRIFNEAIADAVDAEGALLLDDHGLFYGHGLNSGDGWMSDDCAHPTQEGHHQIRRLAWEAWTGASF